MLAEKLNILVIDDKKIIGDLFSYTLGYDGHEIKWINNAYEAVDAVKKKKYDVLFVDIVMPEHDGVSILEEIKIIAPDIPVIMMTGYSVDEKQKRARELGAVTCLKKPFEMSEVKAAIREATGKDVQ